MKLLLDPGHGGVDPGAVAGDITEARYVYDLACRLEKIVLADGLPVEVWKTRDGTLQAARKLSLAERAEIGRTWGADLVLSLHCNASARPAPHGLMAFHWPGSERGQAFADAIQRTAPFVLRRKGGPYPAFAATWPRVRNVLQVHRAPVVLVELGFLTNPGDATALKDPGIQFDLMTCLAAAVRGAVNDFKSVALAHG